MGSIKVQGFGRGHVFGKEKLGSIGVKVNIA